MADLQYQRVISLPLWPGMTEADVARVVGALDGILGVARAKGAA